MERMSVLFVKQRGIVSKPPCGGLWGNVCDYPYLVGKLVVDFMKVIIQHFMSKSAFAERGGSL